MRVVVDPTGSADVAALYVWINTGSADEEPGMEGAAHFVEHMVFKGTRSYGVGEVASVIEGLGGDLNAWTSFDETVFHVTVPAGQVGGAMRVVAEMLRSATFDPAELARERTVILEEIRGSDEDPDSLLSEATYAAAWPDHPYGRPVIGSARTVRKMSRDALYAYYQRRYQPSNACLVVAGPVDVDAVRADATTLFSGGDRVAPRALRRPTARSHQRVLRRGFEANLIDLAWPGPGVGEEGIAALDVACSALGGGVASPLEAHLRLRDGLCLSAEAGFHLERDAGMAVVSLHARAGAATEAVRAARREIEELRAGEIGEREVERAKTQLLADRIFGRETVDGRAHAHAWHLERLGDAEAWRRYDDEVRAVDMAAVVAAARHWLAPEREVRTALLAEGEHISFVYRRAAPVSDVAVGRVDTPAPPPAGPGFRRSSATGRGNPIERVTLQNGARVLLEPDGGEVACARVAGFGGSFSEDTQTVGVGAAWARSLIRGAGSRDALELAAAMEDLAGSLGAAAGRSSMAVRAELLSERFEEGLALLTDVLTAPRFAPKEVAKVRSELREALAEREDHPEHLLMERAWAAIYGAHPYGLAALGTRASVARLRADALRAHHARWAVGNNLVIGVAGGFDVDRVLARLDATIGRLPAGDSFVLPPLPVFPDAPQELTLRRGREHAHVLHAFPGVAVSDADQPAMDLLALVLGGQGGRLFLELREKAGLAYSVSAASQEGYHPGLLVCVVAADPSRLDEAEAKMVATVASVVDGVRPEEIERARRYIVGATELDRQTSGSRANLLAYADLYGQDALRYRTYVRERIEAVTVADVQRVAARSLTRPLLRARLLPGGR